MCCQFEGVRAGEAHAVMRSTEDGGEEAGFVVGRCVRANLLGWARGLHGGKGFGSVRELDLADRVLP